MNEDSKRELLNQVWRAAGLAKPPSDRISLPAEVPLLPTSFHVGTAAQVTVGAAALAAAQLGTLRGGDDREVSVNMHDAERECTGYFSVDGQVPEAWAPLSGLYPCGDGYVRIHANFDHHRDGALRLLGIDKPAEEVSQEEITAALAGRDPVEFETAAAEAGLVVAAMRTFEEWDAHPHGIAIAGAPLLEVSRIGDGKPANLPRIGPGDKPLSGIRVLDLTRILAGPVCGRTLAAYGADVMLVNSPRLPNISAIADTSRGKRSCLIDLATPDGIAQLQNLVSGAHVFIQGYRPGGLDALGFAPSELAARSPGIVYVTLSAYGSVGPWNGRRGFDSLVQTATGFNHAEAVAAGRDRPRALPVQILDYASGFLMAFGVSAALTRQMQEGGSWHVHVSLAQTARWLRGLGRVADNFHQGRPDLGTFCETYPSGFGVLKALPHAALFDAERMGWALASMPPGTHPPGW